MLDRSKRELVMEVRRIDSFQSSGSGLLTRIFVADMAWLVCPSSLKSRDTVGVLLMRR